MATNYYLHHIPTEKDRDPFIKNIHIGKASTGWEFTFKENKNYYSSSYNDLMEFMSNAIASGYWNLIDEYGTKITFNEFRNIIKRHIGGWNYITYERDHPNTFYAGEDYLSKDGTWWCKADFC